MYASAHICPFTEFDLIEEWDFRHPIAPKKTARSPRHGHAPGAGSKLAAQKLKSHGLVYYLFISRVTLNHSTLRGTQRTHIHQDDFLAQASLLQLCPILEGVATESPRRRGCSTGDNSASQRHPQLDVRHQLQKLC